MKKVFRISPIILATIILLLTGGCKKENPESLTLSATNLSLAGATLNGTVNPNGSSTIVTFEYGTTTSYDSSVTAAQSPVNRDGITDVSADISGLTLGSIYHYRVKAENSHWTVYGSDIEFEYGYPPSVTALEATNVTSTAATLKGSVNPRGSLANVTYEYGTSTDYGQQATPEQNLITGSRITDISATISGLTCSTIYHFRLKAENSFYTAYSSDKTILTPAGPPNAFTFEAVKNTCTTATLKGLVQARCASSFVVTFQFGTDMTSYEQELTPDQTRVTAGGDTEVSRNISGLTPATTYYFRLKAESSGETSYGSDLTINTGLPSLTTTSVSAVTATTAISGGTIVDECPYSLITDRGIELWRLVAIPSGIGGRPIFILTKTIHEGSGTGSFTINHTGLSPSTRYYVRAFATNSAGTFHGNYIYFTTPGSRK